MIKTVDSATHPTLAMAFLHEKGGRNVVSFQGITVDEVGFDRSTKQGGKESLTLFNMVMRHWPRPLSAVWKVTGATADIAHDIRGDLVPLVLKQNDAA